MPRNNLGLSDDLAIECLDIALKQRTRKAQTFKPGSAARAEIEAEVGHISLALNTLKAAPIEENTRRK